MLMCQVQRAEECYSRRAQEHAKSCHHFTMKSVAKLPYNPSDLGNTVKSTFSGIYDSVWRLFNIQNNV